MPISPRPDRHTCTAPIEPVPPYSRLAGTYDRLVGDALGPAIRQSFARAIADFRVSFRSAADIGCGTGAFLAYLLRYRVPLWGVDISPAMLRIAARRLPSDRVCLLRQDIRRLALPRRVELIACNGDTLNYLLTPEEMALTLGRCSANLTPGGHLVGDLLTGVPDLAADRRIVAGLAPGTVSLWQAWADPRRRLTRVDIRHGRSGPDGWRWVQETHLQRWYSIADLRAALQEAGLALCALWRLDGAKRPDGGAWIKLLARKWDVEPGAKLDLRQTYMGASHRLIGSAQTAETDGTLGRFSH